MGIRNSENKKLTKDEDEDKEETEEDQITLCSSVFKIMVGLSLIILIIGMTYLAITYFSGFLLKRLIENFDMAFLGVNVTMQHVDFNPFTGVLSSEALEVSNPS